jgi:hypothetical protein
MLLFLLWTFSIAWFSLMGFVVYKAWQIQELEHEFVRIAYTMNMERTERFSKDYDRQGKTK